MSRTRDPITLAHWRRTVAELYAAVRSAQPEEREAACYRFRAARDHMFRSHPQSPLDAEQRQRFDCLDYFPYDTTARVVGRITPVRPTETLTSELPAEGTFRFTRVAQVEFTLQGMVGRLFLYWIEGYGGGLFLPFQDATNGVKTYGGGRYLYDTIKGADFGAENDAFILDFNYAYNPSCAYSPDWVCPLPRPENRLPFAVKAGEKAFKM